MNKQVKQLFGFGILLLAFGYGVISLGSALSNARPHDAHIKCWSNATVIYDGESVGRISINNNSYSFTESGTGETKVVPISQCSLTYKSKVR